MASPIGPPSSPPIFEEERGRNRDSSPLQRRSEVHSRQRSNQSRSDSSASERLQRASFNYRARRSSPLPSEDGSVKPKFKLPLTGKQTKLVTRKTLQEESRGQTFEAPGSSKSSAGNTTDWLSPELLELIAKDERFKDWSGLKYISGRDQVVEDEEPRLPSPKRSSPKLPPPRLSSLKLPSPKLPPLRLPSPILPSPEPRVKREKSRDTSGLSLFNLEPLKITKKTSLGRTAGNATTSENLGKKSQLPKPSFGLIRSPRLHSFRPSESAAPQRKPSRLHIQVTADDFLPSPVKSVEQRPTRVFSPQAELKTPTKTTRFSSAPEVSPTPSFAPISPVYIEALRNHPSASPEYQRASRLRRHASLAKIREHEARSPGLYKSPVGTATPPLKDWISDLGNANMPIPMASSTKSESRVRAADKNESRDKFQNLDDAYADEEGSSRKTKMTPAEELIVMVDDMLNDLTSKFAGLTSEIMAKMDDMERRIDNLEASLNYEAEKGEEDEKEGKNVRS